MDVDLIENYKPQKLKRIKRSDETHRVTFEVTMRYLTQLVRDYQQCMIKGQESRLIFDYISNCVRRFHNYEIEETIGAHYYQVGVPKDECVFEHVIPVAELKQLMVDGLMPIERVLYAPTCLLHKSQDKKLRDLGLVKSTPSRRYFFRRYRDLGVKFATHDGQEISDLESWDLLKHYEYFGRKIAGY